jgi:glucan phosphoethanolaminetransferase (alkaline phosphatase superfamily)
MQTVFVVIAWIITVILTVATTGVVAGDAWWIVKTHQSDDPRRNDLIKMRKIIRCVFVGVCFLFVIFTNHVLHLQALADSWAILKWQITSFLVVDIVSIAITVRVLNIVDEINRRDEDPKPHRA